MLSKYLIHACHVTARFTEGNQWAEKCLEIVQTRYPNQDHHDVAHAFRELGVSLVELRKHNEALEYKKEARDMQTRLLGENLADEALTRAWSEVANSYSQLSNYKKA